MANTALSLWMVPFLSSHSQRQRGHRFASTNLITCCFGSRLAASACASISPLDNISPSDPRHSRTSRRATIDPRWSPSDSVLEGSSHALRCTRRISSSGLSPRRSSRRPLAFTLGIRGSCDRSNPAGEIETRLAMFRNGSPVTRALSIALAQDWSRPGMSSALVRPPLELRLSSKGVEPVHIPSALAASRSAALCFQPRSAHTPLRALHFCH
jgi:hypothetical protein